MRASNGKQEPRAQTRLTHAAGATKKRSRRAQRQTSDIRDWLVVTDTNTNATLTPAPTPASTPTSGRDGRGSLGHGPGWAAIPSGGDRRGEETYHHEALADTGHLPVTIGTVVLSGEEWAIVDEACAMVEEARGELTSSLSIDRSSGAPARPGRGALVRARRWVVNVRNGRPYDVYVGRSGYYYDPSQGRRTRFEGSGWGNPYPVGPAMTRRQSIDAFADAFYASPALLERARSELRGKMLACWCAPEACHAEVLAEWANRGGTKGGSSRKSGTA